MPQRRSAGCAGMVVKNIDFTAPARNSLAVLVFKLLARARGWAISETAMPAAHDLHPDFGLLCPTKRLRRRMRIAMSCVLFTLVGGVVLQASLGPPGTLTSALVEPEAADTVTDSGQAPAALLDAPSLTEADQPGAGNTECERDNSAHRNLGLFRGPMWCG